MATGYSRVADLNSYFNNIYEDAVFAVRESTMATRLVKTFGDGQGDQTRTLSEYSTSTFVEVAETEDYSNPTQFTKTALATLTPAEYMDQGLLTDRRIMTDPDNARADLSMELGFGAAEKVDSDIFGNFSSLTGGTIGGAGTTLTWAHWFAALTVLRGGKVPGPYVCVLHPYHLYNMGTAALPGVTQTNAPDFQDEILRQFWVTRIAGVNVFYSMNCPTSSTDAYSAIFNPLAMAYDLRKDFTLEPERDASKRAWELNASMMYAHGVWRPKWGVQLLADASTPTG